MIPCKDCLVLPICRLKQYSVMLSECELLLKLLYKGPPTSPTRRKHKVFNKEIYNLVNILKPTRWKTTISDEGYIHLVGMHKHDTV